MLTSVREVESAMPSAPDQTARKAVEGVPPVGDTPKSAKAPKEGAASVASAAPKRKPAVKTDREIDRIRRQVDEELKKKTEHGRGPGAAPGARKDDRNRERMAAASTTRAATRAQLARCDRNTNFIGREFCRWKVCNGSWGKNGCPAYEHQKSIY